METTNFVKLLSKVVETVKRLSRQGNLEKLKEARDHIDLAADLVIAIVKDVLGEGEESRALETPEMREVLQEARQIIENS